MRLNKYLSKSSSEELFKESLDSKPSEISKYKLTSSLESTNF